MTTYYVYKLNEKINKYGNSYIGMTKDITTRAKQWKNKLKLDYIPELIVIHSDTSMLRTFNWEQNKRIELQWPRETSLRHQQKMRKKAITTIKLKTKQ
jgi:hypothetical protein